MDLLAIMRNNLYFCDVAQYNLRHITKIPQIK